MSRIEYVESYRPPRWLRGAHVQSILPSSPLRDFLVRRRAAPVVGASEEVLLEGGDGVRLLGLVASQAKRGFPAGERVAVLLHGWEGSAESLYVLALAQRLFERGYEVVRLNLRDHGPTHHLNRDLFHSCRLPEVIGATRSIQQRYPGQPLHLVGWSLGGNFQLRVAARAAAEDLRVARVVAVSPVLDPRRTMHELETGLWLYHDYFVRKWSASLDRKQAAWPGVYDFRAIGRVRSLQHMTAELVARHTDYPSLEAYLAGYAITGERLQTLEAPATIITAADDPMIPIGDLDRLAQRPNLHIRVTRWGGHCGFLLDLTGPSWIEQAVVEELERDR